MASVLSHGNAYVLFSIFYYSRIYKLKKNILTGNPGFTGEACETSSVVCKIDTCKNGGKCTETTKNAAGYECSCLSSFTGANCEIGI